jgi:hypothetical protein
MAWIVVPNLLELREQLDKIAPNRDRASDGTVGDYDHSQGKSSHNPDDIRGNAEWEGDPDGKEEIRAIDLDVDYRVPGLTAQEFVNHLIKYAKNGTFWWIRYIIYDRKIYHKNTGFESRAYGGSNPHDKHVHVNSDFSQRADEVDNVNYRLSELVEDDMDAKELIATLRNNKALSDTDVYRIAVEVSKILNTAFAGVPKGVWDYQLPNPYINTNQAAGTILRYAPSRAPHEVTQALVNQVLEALAAIGQKVDLDASELEAIKSAIVIPSPEQNAEAVVDALGGVPTEDLAEALRNVLSDEKREALAAALLA